MVKKTLFIFGIILILIAGTIFFVQGEVGAPAGQDTPNPDTANSQRPPQDDTTKAASQEPVVSNTVEIRDFNYTPSTITVKKGTKVTWINRDSIRHDVVPDQSSASFKKSELLGRNESYSMTFEATGTFTYHCTPHPDMKGTVIVTE